MGENSFLLWEEGLNVGVGQFVLVVCRQLYLVVKQPLNKLDNLTIHDNSEIESEKIDININLILWLNA